MSEPLSDEQLEVFRQHFAAGKTTSDSIGLHLIAAYLVLRDRSGGWVKAEEKLPPTPRYVLAHSTDAGAVLASYENGRWVDDWDDGINEVTHWMPLPEPPTQLPPPPTGGGE